MAKPEIKEFVQYYMTNGAKLTKEVKYVPLPDSAYKTAWDHVLKMKKGTPPTPMRCISSAAARTSLASSVESR